MLAPPAVPFFSRMDRFAAKYADGARDFQSLVTSIQERSQWPSA